ncbi:MAG: hypothetical protein HOW73_21550 [Polyangiaceae bacterium]|nr:hypothetical protein [Polyangiaceae bacterium]
MRNLILALCLAACGSEEPKRTADGSATSTARSSPSARPKSIPSASASAAIASSSAPLASASSAPSVKKEFVLKGRNDKDVKVRFVPPEGWHDNERDDFVSIQGKWLSLLYISVTCHGNCSEKTDDYKKNIQAYAEEQLKDMGPPKRSPPLVAQWIQKPKEEPKNVFTYEVLGQNEEHKQEEHLFEIDRILDDPPSVLSCSVKIDEREEKGRFEQVAGICKTLEWEVVATKK